MTKKTLILWCFAIMACSSFQLAAQTGAVKMGDGAAVATPMAVLDVQSTTQGMLIPRVNLTTDVSAPAQGLLIYQLQDPKGFYHYNGSAWTPWTKPVHGVVDMALGTTPVSGDGYTITHSSLGNDLISFDTPYTQFPVVHISNSAITGTPPAFPAGLCQQITAGCSNVNLNFLNLDHLNDGSYEFQTGTTDCNISPGNRTSYPLASPYWLSAPPTMAIGDNIRLRFRTNLTAYSVSIWGDWNANGVFELTERMYSEATPVSLNTRNADFTIPASACTGNTVLRVTVSDIADNEAGCDIATTALGETEEIQITIAGAPACVYQEKQVSCNVQGATTTEFRVACTSLSGSPVDGKYYFKVTEY